VTDIPLAVEVDYFRITPTAYFVPVSVKVPGSVIDLAQKRGGGETEFDFLGQILDDAKVAVGTVRDYIKVKLEAGEAAKLSHRNFHYDAGFTLSPGKYRMKFLVRENLSRQDGHVRHALRGARPDGRLGVLKTSSVIWSNQREPFKAAVGAAENERAARRTARPNRWWWAMRKWCRASPKYSGATRT